MGGSESFRKDEISGTKVPFGQPWPKFVEHFKCDFRLSQWFCPSARGAKFTSVAQAVFPSAIATRAHIPSPFRYRLPSRNLRHPPDIRGTIVRADLPYGFRIPARSSATDRDARKIPSWRTHHVRQKTHLVVRASILCHLGGGATCAGWGNRAGRLGHAGSSIPIGATDRKHRSATNRKHGTTSDGQHDPAANRLNQSQYTGHATFHDESQ
jgi:hypothetical protein